MYNVDDAIAKIDGYVISIAGGGPFVGEQKLVRIDEVKRTAAYASLISENGGDQRRPRGGGGRARRRSRRAAGGASRGGAETRRGGGRRPRRPSKQVQSDGSTGKRRRGRRGGRRRSRAQGRRRARRASVEHLVEPETMAYAIIEMGGKQYRVEKGDSVLVDRVDAKEGAKVTPRALLYAVRRQTVMRRAPSSTRSRSRRSSPST